MPNNTISYRGYVYLIGSYAHQWFKIGRTRNVSNRMRELGILLPFAIQEVCLWKTDNPVAAEKMMHEKYADDRINGEWFRFKPEMLANVVRDDHSTGAICMHIEGEIEPTLLDQFNRQDLRQGQSRLMHELMNFRVLELTGSGLDKKSAWKQVREEFDRGKISASDANSWQSLGVEGGDRPAPY